MADGCGTEASGTDLFEHPVFFPFIAQEIIRLKKAKGMQFHQFAVLVRNRFQALNLAAFFEKRNIPFKNQRGASLAGSEAHQTLIDLVRAVLRPHDWEAIGAVMGSPLMGWTHEEIRLLKRPESVLLMVGELRSALFEKGFSIFFQELLLYNGKSGKTILEEQLSRQGGRDFLRDMQQIADLAADYQYQEWSSPEGILSFLDNFTRWEFDEDERVKRLQDPTQEGVHIITQHYSKGLEFDIVFALGLADRRKNKEHYVPAESAGRTFLTPFDRASKEFCLYCEEQDAEKMRQLYVALTRAKTQLYIPAILNLLSPKLELGDASPLDLFLGKLGQPAISYQALYERLKEGVGTDLIDFLEGMGTPRLISFSIHQSLECDALPEEAKEAFLEGNPLLPPPSQIHIKKELLKAASFTSLNHDRETGEQLKKRTDNSSSFIRISPSDFNFSDKSVHTLPAHSDTGLLIHQILEKVPFHHFNPLTSSDQAIPFIIPFVEKTSFAGWEGVLAEIVFNTLKVPLFESESFCLAQLESPEYFREMPFTFSFALQEFIKEEEGKGLMKGVIDCLFFYQGRYFLVDWKSNWLGPEPGDYNEAAMHLAMEENGYYLQASIYKEAIMRFLKLIDPRPFEDCFGGVFYLFLRGIQKGKMTGIFNVPSSH